MKEDVDGRVKPGHDGVDAGEPCRYFLTTL